MINLCGFNGKLVVLNANSDGFKLTQAVHIVLECQSRVC